MNNVLKPLITLSQYLKKSLSLKRVLYGSLMIATQAHAAVALDRTRVVFDGGQLSVSMNVSNQNTQMPYLAQAWIEDEQGNKIQSPFTVLPPLQRIEPGKASQVKIQALPAATALPQDRETIYYFNLREIPPKSTKPNSLQIALQTRIKMFYRPAAIAIASNAPPPQEKLTLTRQGEVYRVNNPTPYYITLVDASRKKGTTGLKEYEPIMIAPKSSMPLTVSVSAIGNTPALTYINDYGGRPELSFTCSAAECKIATKDNQQ